jgi:ribose-phosphate pyrophosphokinase
MKLYSGKSNVPLSKKIAKDIGLTISPIEEHVFPDGERRIRISENVVGESAIVVQSANTPVEAHYMELFFIVDGLKRSGAEFVTAVVPYFGYQRQDHVFRDGEAVSLEVMIKVLQTVGVDTLISVDMHSTRIPDLFSIPVKHLSALPLFAEKINVILEGAERPIGSSGLDSIASLAERDSLQNDTSILVSPDMGGIARIKKMAELTGLPYAALEKNRDLETGFLSGDAVIEGSVENKKIAFIVDDMISSGKTIALAAKSLKKLGLEKIYVFATHAVFSEEASEILQQADIEKVYVSDTVLIPEKNKFEKLEILSVAGIIAKQLAA